MMRPITLLVAGLAGQRAAQAISTDKISQPTRDRILLWSMFDEQTPEQYERRRRLHTFVSCPHCVGFWLSAITLGLYSISRGRRSRVGRAVAFIVEWWAVASIGTMLSAAWGMFTDVAHHASVRGEIAEHELRQMTRP